MRPDERTATPLSDLFRLKLVNLIDLRHELCRLAQKLPWQALVDEFGALYAEAGRPGVPIRLMVGLNYLKHAHELSDEVSSEELDREPVLAVLLRGGVFPASVADRSVADDALSHPPW